jgi:DNA helicase HerA-like ATPase
MAKECRKYGISLVIASQEARDFHPSLFSAIANYLILKLNEPDAKALVTNVINSKRQKNSIDHIKGMERFHAYYLQEGQQLPVHVSLRME